MTYSTKAVAEILGCHQKNINYYHSRYGLGFNQDGRLRWTDDDIAEIKKLREAKGK